MRLKLGLLGILLVVLVAVVSAAPPWQQNEKPQINGRLRSENQTLKMLTETSNRPRTGSTRLKRK